MKFMIQKKSELFITKSQNINYLLITHSLHIYEIRKNRIILNVICVDLLKKNQSHFIMYDNKTFTAIINILT